MLAINQPIGTQWYRRRGARESKSFHEKLTFTRVSSMWSNPVAANRTNTKKQTPLLNHLGWRRCCATRERSEAIDNVVATSSEHQLNPETKRQPRFGSTDQPIEEKENDTSVRHTRGARRGGDGTDGKWATTPKCVCVDRWGEGGASDGMKEQEGLLPVHTQIRDRCYGEWHEPFYWTSFVLFSHYQQDMRCSPFGCCNICCTRGR